MPISNKSSQNRMTTTTIRLDPSSTTQQKNPTTQRTNYVADNNQPELHKIVTVNNRTQPDVVHSNNTRRAVSTEIPKTANTYRTVESRPAVNFENLPPLESIPNRSPRIIRVARGTRTPPLEPLRSRSPQIIRVARAPRTPQPSPPPAETTTTSVVIKDTTTRGTTPPPASLFETSSAVAQRPPKFSTTTGVWPGMYQLRSLSQQQQRQQQSSTVQYQNSTGTVAANSSTDVFVQQPQTNTTTTTKTSTRVLEKSTLPTIRDDSFIEETTTTRTIIRPTEVPTAAATVVTSTAPVVVQAAESVAVAPAVNTIVPITRHRHQTRRRRRPRTLSLSTYSDYTTSSTDSYTSSTVTPQHQIIKQHTVLPPRPPIQTTIINDAPTTIVPQRRIIHRVRRTRTDTGYYSSDLDYGKRKVYKSDYKYRHFYYCNWFKGRCDLPNRSCGFCEWFYGCPVWALIILGLFFLALLASFFALLGLQTTINSARRAATAQTRVLNRTVIVYGFLQNCGFQANVPTTLALCTNTQLTTTVVQYLSSFFTTLNSTSTLSSNPFLFIMLCICTQLFLKVNQ